MPKLLTIIICTYNRNRILSYLLDSLKIQTTPHNQYDIVIVDNYNDNKNHENLKELVAPLQNAKVIRQNKKGLSHARNIGYEKCQTEWVTYLDDDCRVPPDFVTHLLSIINKENFDAFGGHIDNWWLYPRPKWMPPAFGIKPALSKTQKILESDEYLWGGNMSFKREVLFSSGGFDPNIGMKGGKIGYAAENRIQQKLRTLGYIIGYNPLLVVHHLVGIHKYRLLWHLKASYAEGRDGKPVFPQQYTFKYMGLEKLKLIRTWYKATLKLLRTKDYYWQNMILDCGKPIFKLIGKAWSFYRS